MIWNCWPVIHRAVRHAIGHRPRLHRHIVGPKLKAAAAVVAKPVVTTSVGIVCIAVGGGWWAQQQLTALPPPPLAPIAAIAPAPGFEFGPEFFNQPVGMLSQIPSTSFTPSFAPTITPTEVAEPASLVLLFTAFTILFAFTMTRRRRPN